MSYLIIGMSFALIVGSLMWMLPSPKEKRLAKLRANASAANFHPKFIKFENYLQLIPSNLKDAQKKPERPLLRYFWEGQSPLMVNRTLQFVFSEQVELLSLRVDGKDVDGKLQGEWVESIGIALGAAHYFQGLLALECRDNEGKRLLSLYWPESGDIGLIDFNAVQIQALQTRL